MSYRPFFGLTREPFSADLETSAILQTDELLAIGQRVEYVIRIGGIALVLALKNDEQKKEVFLRIC